MTLLEKDIWKNDSITRSYKREHADILNSPSKMSIKELADACTYCNNWDNPYSRQIVKRASLYDQYDSNRNLKHKREILNKACAGFGIKMF